MEYVPGGELFTHLRNKGAFDPDKAAYFWGDIVFTLLK
jgi:hypothetical protein